VEKNPNTHFEKNSVCGEKNVGSEREYKGFTVDNGRIVAFFIGYI
jgi:hypothetical protein